MAGTSHIAFVVDDEPQWRTLVSNVLTSSGYKALQFSTNEEVVVALATSMPRLIVLDLSLGGSDAVEVIRSLAIGQFAGNVMLMSGHDPKTVAEVQEIGSRHGLKLLPPLQKPFRINDLRHRLADLQLQPDKTNVDTSLKTALQNNWLELWYQPKIDLKSGELGGAEALIRLRHPEIGLLEPARFLPPAGDASYVPLTEFIGRHAMADWEAFAQRGMTRRVAINVPCSVLQRPDFVGNLRRYFPKDPRFPGLIVEITEDEAIDDPLLAREIAIQLKLYNVFVSIDDFGSGYSTLGRLTDLPFSEIKLDRSFVSGCSRDPKKLAMCKAVVELARRFEIGSVAEGVETVEDLRVIAELGYDMAQGFLYAKPMPASDFIRFIGDHRRGS